MAETISNGGTHVQSEHQIAFQVSQQTPNSANSLAAYLKGYSLRQAWKFGDPLGMGISPTLYNYAVDEATRSNIPLSQVISERANGYHKCNPRGAAKHHLSVLSTMNHETFNPLMGYYWIPTTLPLVTE